MVILYQQDSKFLCLASGAVNAVEAQEDALPVPLLCFFLGHKMDVGRKCDTGQQSQAASSRFASSPARIGHSQH